VAVGIIPGGGGTQRLPRAIGPGRAAELVLSGRVIGSAEAERIGLVQAVLPDDGFIASALEWAGQIAARPRHAVVAAKQALVQGMQLPLVEGLRLEGRLFLECQLRPETVELEERAAERERAAAPDQRVDL
jgi:enoyl-CoA hydratase